MAPARRGCYRLFEWLRAWPRVGPAAVATVEAGSRTGEVAPQATLSYSTHQQCMPPTICIMHSKDIISKSPFSTSSTRYKRCMLLDFCKSAIKSHAKETLQTVPCDIYAGPLCHASLKSCSLPCQFKELLEPV